ncbi:MAG: glycosyl hydrolase 108 family protein, partial [Kluyvera sp.]
MNPIIDGIISIEGSYSTNAKDSGGRTNWGITEAVARAHGYSGDMRNLTYSEAYSSLEKDYWIKPGFEQVAQLSYPISF